MCKRQKEKYRKFLIRSRSIRRRQNSHACGVTGAHACAGRQRGQCLCWFSFIRIHTVDQTSVSVSSSHSEASALPLPGPPNQRNRTNLSDLYSYPRWFRSRARPVYRKLSYTHAHALFNELFSVFVNVHACGVYRMIVSNRDLG